jgi:2-polyprenyl-3-methyl-5-hydroxy-6-metoxy-1,4-benzoquinol methylase
VKITDSDYGKMWDLCQCADCTHIFANPYPSKEIIQSLYREIEDPLYQEEERGRSKNFLRILTALEAIQPNKGILFDVGAATGILMDRAKKRGWTAEGIEASTWAVRTAREKYNLEIQNGFFEEARLPEGRYAVVTMVDFIEHISHPFDAISKANKILSPEGILCLVTPDINSLAAKIMGRKWWHCRPAHLGFFTKKSLPRVLQRGGFRIVKRKNYSWTFSAHYLLSRISWLNFFTENPILSSILKKIPIKLILQDSFEIYAQKAPQE